MGIKVEALQLGYGDGCSSFVRERITKYGAGVYDCSRLAWAATAANIVRLHDEGALRILINMTMLSSDETSLVVGFKRKKQVISSALLDEQVGSKHNTTYVREKSLAKILQSEHVKVIAIQWKYFQDFDIISCELLENDRT